MSRSLWPTLSGWGEGCVRGGKVGQQPKKLTQIQGFRQGPWGSGSCQGGKPLRYPVSHLYPTSSHRFLESCLLSPFSIGGFLFLTSSQPFLRSLSEILLFPWLTWFMGISEKPFVIALDPWELFYCDEMQKTLWADLGPPALPHLSACGLRTSQIPPGEGTGLPTLNFQPSLGFLFFSDWKLTM